MGMFTTKPEAFKDHVRTIVSGENIIINRDGKRVELDRESAGLVVDALFKFSKSEG